MITIFADHKRDQHYCLLGNISVRKMFLLERSFEDMLRRLVEQVIVHKDGRYTVEFKSGTSIVLNYTKG